VLDYYRGGGVCVVEWFDRFPDEQPPEFLQLTLAISGRGAAACELGAAGAQPAAVGAAWLEASCRRR